jgi:hypothetical protein
MRLPWLHGREGLRNRNKEKGHMTYVSQIAFYSITIKNTEPDSDGPGER